MIRGTGILNWHTGIYSDHGGSAGLIWGREPILNFVGVRNKIFNHSSRRFESNMEVDIQLGKG